MNNKPWSPYHYRPDAETVLKREQTVRTVKRCLIAAIAAFLTGGILGWIARIFS